MRLIGAALLALTGTAYGGTLGLSSTDLNFYGQTLGQPSPPVPVQLYNTNVSALTVESITFSDPSYSQTGGITPPFTIAGGGSTTIELTCTPNQLGSNDATATYSTDTETLVQTLECNGHPVFLYSPDPIAFGAQPLGVAGGVGLTLENSGAATLTVSSVTISGPDAADFAVQGMLPISLPYDTSTGLGITFTPSRVGDETASLTLTTTDQASPMPVIAMTGTGYMPNLAFSTMSLDFGDLQFGVTSAALPVTVTNQGTTEVVARLGLQQPNAGFAIDRDMISLAAEGMLDIPPGGSTILHITFTPDVLGPAHGSVLLPIAEPPVAIALTGNGVPVDIELDPSSLDFGDVGLNHVATRAVTITNRSTEPLLLSNMHATNSAFNDVDIHQEVAGGDSLTLEVTFEPTLTGSAEGFLVVSAEANASSGPVAAMRVRGTGAPDAGGGCDAAGGGSAFSLALLGGAAALRRRRARR